ncbi:MAG: tetratricopeptide repeat protein [Hyphomicrobiales bacterium]
MGGLYRYLLFFVAFTLCSEKASSQEESESVIFSKAFRKINTKDHREAFAVFKSLLHNTEDVNIIMKTLTALAQYYTNINIPDSSLYFAHQALDILNDKADTLSLKRKILLYNSVAIANKNKSCFDKAIKWHLKGAELSEKLSIETYYYQHIHGLAYVYMEKSELDKAIKLFEECSKSEVSIQFQYGSLINIGVIKGDQGKYKEAIKYFEKAYSLCEDYNDEQCELVILVNLGKYHEHLKEYNKALDYLNEAEELARSSEKVDLYIDALISKESIYIEQKQYQKAKAVLNKALVECKAFGSLDQLKIIYDHIRYMYLSMGDYKKAYSFLDKQIVIADSIRDLQNEKKIKELEYKFFSYKKEKELEDLRANREQKELELKRHKEIQQIMLISILLISIAVLVTIFIFWQKLKAQKQLVQKQEEINQSKVSSLLQEQKLKLIKASVDGQNIERGRVSRILHDSVGGNLAAIKLQLSNLSSNHSLLKKLYFQIDETYEQVRDISHNLTPKSFEQLAFSSLVEEYFTTIQQVSNIKMNFNVYPKEKVNSLKENYLIEIYRFIQELTNNTIKYAQASIVDLQINVSDTELVLIYEDNGLGFDTKKIKSGIGLKNINSRVSILSGKFFYDSAINRGAVFTIEIPILEQYEHSV